MKTTITREGVFETNSSSSHSISIAPFNLKMNTLVKDAPIIPAGSLHSDVGWITIEEGEFGWGVETYRDSASKASYCLTHAHENEEQKAMLKKVIEDVTNCEVSFGSFEGYIDHQSVGTANAAFESEESLRNFIFNPASVLYIDHDNH